MLVEAEKLMQIALILPSAVFVGWLGGAWLDKHLHQSWIALVGMVFGGIAGMFSVFRLVTETGRRIEAGTHTFSDEETTESKEEKTSGNHE